MLKSALTVGVKRRVEVYLQSMRSLVLLLFLSTVISLKAQLCFNSLNAPNVLSLSGRGNENVFLSADLNGDGHMDIVTHGGASAISVLLGIGNGSFSAATNYPAGSNLSLNSNAISSAKGDFNNDGAIDIAISDNYLPGVHILMGTGTGAFLAPVTYTLGSSVSNIFPADMNGDNFTDLVLGNLTNNSISVLFGSANGTFANLSVYPVSSNVSYVVSGDYNLDGNPDFATVDDMANTMSVILNSGAGTYTTAGTYTVGAGPKEIISEDFNHDGYKDLITTNCFFSNTISVLKGSATGVFSAPVNYGCGSQPFSITHADLNADGNLDLAIANYDNSSICVMSGLGTGAFAAPEYYISHDGGVAIISGDFNEDGIMDLLTNHGLNTPYTSYLTLYRGKLNGTFDAARNYPVGTDIRGQASADFDGNGSMDLIVTNWQYNTMSVFLNTGTGLLSPAGNYTVGNSPTCVATADFNADGHMDVAIGAVATGSLYVFLGNGTGSFSVNAVYSGLPTYDIEVRDFNNDGIKDLALASGCQSGAIGILMGTGNGFFAPCVSYVSGTVVNIASADFNNDGYFDIAACHSGGGGVFKVFFNSGTGTFSTNTVYATSYQINGIESADFNNDGNKDLLLMPGLVGDPFRVILGSPSGVFTNTISVNGIRAATSIDLKDFNNDGNMDIAVPGYPIEIFLGTGTGSFVAGASFNTTPSASSLLSSDFNGDGNPDFSTVNNKSISIITSMGYPLLNINSANSVCAGNSIGLNATGAVTYSWSTGAVSNSIMVNPLVNTTYTVTGTNSGGCSSSAVKTITVTANPLPSVSLTSSSNTVCVGSNVTFTATGASTYLWSTGANSQTITTTPTVNATYTVTGTDANNCYNTATLSVSIIANPTLTVNSGSICSGQSFTMNPSGALSYTYSSGSATVSPAVNATYTVTGTNANGCTANAISSVAVSPTPTITVNSGTICSHETFTITSSGAATYTYSSGSNTVSPTTNSTYTITGTDVNGCVSTTGAISTLSVNAVPSLTATSNASVCVGTSTVLNVSGTANAYFWSIGATTTSISVSPAITTTYTVTGIGINNCSATQTVAVTVNPNCQDVWPGDANSDGVADNLDILELGLHFTQSGPARATTGNAWQSYFSNNWAGTISNGKNINHSDCNGDGTIDANDTLAIFNNYGLTHAFKPAEPTTINPQLSIVPDQNMVAKGDWGTASVFLGEASSPITNINGLAFTVALDQSFIDANSFYVEYPVSFLNTGNQNLKFQKSDAANGKLYTATTHTNNVNVTGYGKIAVLHYKIKSNLATDEVLNLGISQSKQSNANGVLTPITAGTATLAAIGASVSIDELSNGNSIALYPNPANTSATIQSSGLLQKVEVLSLTGQIILSETASGTQHQLDLSNVAIGVYFVAVYRAGQKVSRKKLVVQR